MSERHEKDLSGFVGGTVVGVITDPDHEYFGLQIRIGGKVRDLWFECDDEQNGPGSFSVGEWTDPDR